MPADDRCQAHCYCRAPATACGRIRPVADFGLVDFSSASRRFAGSRPGLPLPTPVAAIRIVGLNARKPTFSRSSATGSSRPVAAAHSPEVARRIAAVHCFGGPTRAFDPLRTSPRPIWTPRSRRSMRDRSDLGSRLLQPWRIRSEFADESRYHDPGPNHSTNTAGAFAGCAGSRARRDGRPAPRSRRPLAPVE